MKRVTAGVIRMNGKILVARRPPGDRLEGYWEFPGGKIEPRETPEECLKRELLEELGIEVEVGEFLCSVVHAYPQGEIELLAYWCEANREPSLMTSHSEYRWVAAHELLSYRLAPADIPIAEKVVTE